MKYLKARCGVYAVIALAALAVAACAGDRGRGGVLVISTAGDADVLFPPTARNQVSEEVLDLLFERLADIGPDLNTIGDSGWTPRLADRWEWSADSMAVTFHLNPNARWHDSVPVRASDIRFTYQLYTASGLGGSDGLALADVTDSMSVVDSLTCKFWFKRRAPERFYAVAHALYPLPEHILASVPVDSLRTSAFTRSPVGNGPFRLVQWVPGQRIEIAAVPDFHGKRSQIDRVIWTIAQDGAVATQRVLAGEADFIASLTSAELKQVEANPELRTVPLGVSSYAFLIFNMHQGATDKAHPLLSDRALRRALTRALDRQAIVTNLLGDLGRVSIGPVLRTQWSADTTLQQLAFDREGAARTLDSLGWRVGPNGVRMRGGKPLSFSILVPVSSQPRVALAILLQEQWRQVGVDLAVERLEGATMGARMRQREFDAAVGSVAAAPSPNGLRQIWSTSAIAMSNGMNVGRFSNPAIDTLIDNAVTASTKAAGRQNYRAAYQALLNEAPAIWLYEQAMIAAVNRRVTVAPFSFDSWSSSIPAWRVNMAGLSRGDTTQRAP